MRAIYKYKYNGKELQDELGLNKIRKELGSSFGQRMIYNDFRINMSHKNIKGQVFRAYSPFSLQQLRNGQTPTTMFSIFK